jgi:hypothetical protein
MSAKNLIDLIDKVVPITGGLRALWLQLAAALEIVTQCAFAPCMFGFIRLLMSPVSGAEFLPADVHDRSR